MWLNEFKAALVLEQIDTISSLIDEIPHFETLEEIEQAAYLLQQASELAESNKRQTTQTLQHLKSTIDYLKSSQTPTDSSLNIKL
jgi:hypothetical protein